MIITQAVQKALPCGDSHHSKTMGGSHLLRSKAFFPSGDFDILKFLRKVTPSGDFDILKFLRKVTPFGDLDVI